MAYAAQLRQPHQPARRHRPGHRRRHRQVRIQRGQRRPAGRGLEPGHGDLAHRRCHVRAAALPLGRAASARRARVRLRLAAATPECPTSGTTRSTRPLTCSRAPGLSITQAPSTVQYGTSAFVQTPDAANITSVSLIRTGSVTHSFDQNTRALTLPFTQASGGLTVQLPADGNVAPARLLHAQHRQRQRRSLGQRHGPVPGAVGGHRPSHRPDQPDRDRRRGPGQASPGPPAPTTSASPTTTSTGPPARASRRARRTRSPRPSGPRRRTTTPDSPPAPTTTRSRPRTPRRTSVRPPTKPLPPSPATRRHPPRRPGSRPQPPPARWPSAGRPPRTTSA